MITIIVKRERNDYYGNPRFNIRVVGGRSLNLTSDILEAFNKTKLLKNGSINVTKYEFQVVDRLEMLANKKYKNWNLVLV